MSRTASPPTRGTPSAGRGASRTANGRSRSGARSRTPARPVGKPHGPSAATFRRRRLTVLVIVLVLLAGAFIGVRSAVDAAGAAVAAAEEPAPKVAGAEPVTGVAEQGGPPTAYELANPVACRPEAIGVGVSLASSTVKKGATTTVPVRITNNGQVPCLLEIGSAQLVMTIYSGDDKIWDSRHCASGGDSRILLDAGAVDETVFTWKGVRSNPDCPAKPSKAKPGTYRVITTLLDSDGERVARAEQTFTIS